MYTVYILISQLHGITYIGQTQNVEKRLSQHNQGRSQYTKKYVPWKVLHEEKFLTLKEAVARERYFKSASGRKAIRKLYSEIV